MFRKVVLSQPLSAEYTIVLAKSALNQEDLSKGYHVKDEMVWFQGRLWVPAGPLRLEIIQDHHDGITVGHPGKAKTLELIQRTYNWKGLPAQVGRYCKECLICNQIKPNWQPLEGLLVPVQKAEGPWTSLSVDFIVELPASDGYDANGGGGPFYEVRPLYSIKNNNNRG